MVPLGDKGGAGQMGWFTVGGFVVSKIKGGSLFFDKYVRVSASSTVADYLRTGSTRFTLPRRETIAQSYDSIVILYCSSTHALYHFLELSHMFDFFTAFDHV